jgi:hypothetical protein
MCGAIPPLPQFASMAWKNNRDNFTFNLTFINVYNYGG